MKILYTFLLIASSIVLISSSGGRAAAAGEGNTGAPGDDPKLCMNCHSSGTFGPEVIIELKDSDGTLVDAYEPGVIYTAQVSIMTSSDPEAHGFQMVALTNQDNTSTNSFSNPSSNTKLTSLNSRQYAEHNQPSATNSFTMEWTAPAEGSGAVTFYAAGNAVNLNGGTSGDGANNSSLQIEEAITSSSKDLSFADLQIFPNPSNGIVNIAGLNENIKVISVFDMYGKQIINSTSNNQEQQIDLTSYAKGIYILQFQTIENEIFSKKIILLQ